MATGVNANQSAGRAVSGRRARFVLPALVLVVIAAGAATWAGRASNAVRVVPGAEVPAAAGAAFRQSAPPQAPSDWVQTALTPSGFTPNEVSHAAGQVSLLVKNRSGQAEVTLRLSKAGGEIVTEVKLTEKVRAWSGSFELAAGSYTLSEAAHPDWTCRIEVSPR